MTFHDNNGLVITFNTKIENEYQENLTKGKNEKS